MDPRANGQWPMLGFCVCVILRIRSVNSAAAEDATDAVAVAVAVAKIINDSPRTCIKNNAQKNADRLPVPLIAPRHKSHNTKQS